MRSPSSHSCPLSSSCPRCSYYFACVLPSLVFLASPFAFLWNGVHLLVRGREYEEGLGAHISAGAGGEGCSGSAHGTPLPAPRSQISPAASHSGWEGACLPLPLPLPLP